MTVPPFTYTWIEANKILIGSIPSTPQDIETLVSLGITEILSLTRRDIRTYPGVDTAITEHKILVEHFPIPDGGIPVRQGNDPENFRLNLALNFLDSAYHGYSFNDYQSYPVYVHCRGGIGRSGIILQAWYCLRRGYTLEQARDMLRVRRNYEGNACAADQGTPQREWLEQLVSMQKEE